MLITRLEQSYLNFAWNSTVIKIKYKPDIEMHIPMWLSSSLPSQKATTKRKNSKKCKGKMGTT